MPELGQAFAAAGVDVSPAQLQALTRGLRDGVGLLAYNELTKTLLWRSKQQQQAPARARPHSAMPATSLSRSSSSAGPQQAPPSEPAPALQPQHQHPQPEQQSPASRSPPPGAPSEPSAAAPPTPRAGSGSASPRPRPDAPPTPSYLVGQYTADHDALAEAGVPPPGCMVLGPDGAQYFSYKGRTHWFAGNEPQEHLAQAAREYRAVDDLTHSVAMRYASKGLGDGGQLLAGGGGARPATAGAIRDMPTAASQLKDGSLTAEELRQQLELKHLRPAAVEATMRATPAAKSLQPAPRSGASLGVALRAVAGGGGAPGVAGMGEKMLGVSAWGSPLPAGSRGARSISARPGAAGGGRPGTAVVSSFTSVANAGPAAVSMNRHEGALLREEVAQVRSLPRF